MDASLHLLIDRVRAAAADATPLCLQGGGTKCFYGEPPQGQVLDVRGHAGVVSYEPTELVVTVRAGTLLADLEAQLAEQGQCLPFEPPHFAPGATVGGMVASGLSGPARATVGSVRDYVLGLQMLNGRGQVLSFGGQVMKNVAGYDVSRLMAGSLGVLGLITEVSLKVLPQAPAEATLVFALPQDQALTQLHCWGGQPLPLNASCWVEEAGQPRLYLRLRGAVAAVEAACTRLLAEVPGQRLDAAAVATDWSACRDQTLPFFEATAHPGACLWRLSLPPTAPVLALPWPTLVEWQGGQRWLWAPASEAEPLRLAAREVGGSASLFRANNQDLTRVEGRFDALSPPLMRIHRQLKAEFDPAGLFNPGRLYPAL